ncbi:hypothetical protein B7463_g11276, partial [Scytalidium lignicola]
MEVDSSQDKPRITRLGLLNYRTWSVQVKAYLQGQELWEVVSQGISMSQSTTRESSLSHGSDLPPQDVPLPSIDRLRSVSADGRARSIIMSYCTPSTLEMIIDLETAKEQWDTLKEYIAPLGIQQLGAKLMAFNSYMPPKTNATVLRLVTDLNALQNEIGAISKDDKPSNNTKIAVLLRVVEAMDSRFHSIVTQLSLSKQDVGNYDVVVAHLTEFERRIGPKEPAKESVLNATEKGEKGKKGKKPFKGVCFNCGKTGHIARFCRAPKKEGDSSPSTGALPTPSGVKEQPKEAQKSKAEAKTARETCWSVSMGDTEEQECPAYAVDDGSNELLWVIDSGASRHMTYSREAFSDYEPLETPIQVVTANGMEIQAVGTGNVPIKAALNGRVEHVKLTGVLHVPELAGSLISVLQLQDRGLTVETTAGKARKLLIKLHGKVVGEALRIGRSYTLKSTVQSEQAFVATVTDAGMLWHRRFGHLSSKSLARLHQATTGEERPVITLKEPCEACTMAKKVKVINRKGPERVTKPLERIHTDMWGPYRIPSRNGNTYMITFTDEYTRKVWVYFSQNRVAIHTIFPEFKAKVELETGYRIKAVRCDNAKEYVALGNRISRITGIQFEYIVPYFHEQLGIPERLNRTLITLARTMLWSSQLPAMFWEDAVETACYVRNRTPIGPDGKTPEEAYSGKKPYIGHLRAFGCIAYPIVAKEKLTKLEPTSLRCCFIGYMVTDRQYKLYDPVSRKVIVTSSPTFREDLRLDFDWNEPIMEPMEEVEILDFMEPPGDIPEDANLRMTIAVNQSSQHDVEAGQSGQEASITPWEGVEPVTSVVTGISVPEPSEEPPGEPTAAEPQEPHEPLKPPDVTEPTDLEEPEPGGRNTPELRLGDPESDDAESVIEVDTSAATGERETSYGPPTVRRSGRVRKPSRKAQENPESAFQVEEVFIPKNEQEVLRDPLWLAAMDLEIKKLQALGTWEIGDLPVGSNLVGYKWVFTVKYTLTGLVDYRKARLVAQGFSQTLGDDYLETFSPTMRLESLRVLLAIVALEDLEIYQADVMSAYPRAKLHTTIYMRPPNTLNVMEGKVPCYSDPSVFINQDKSMIIGLYVDDILVLGKDPKTVRAIVDGIGKRWQIKDLGPVQRILGLRVTRDRANCSLRINQSQYITELVKRFHLQDAKPVNSPVTDRNTLVKGLPEEPQADQALYQELIGQLGWVTRGSRFDISYVVGQLQQHCNAPTVRHMNAGLRVVRYLNGTVNKELYIGTDKDRNGPGEPMGARIQGYSDADYAGDLLDRRSTTGHIFLLNGGPISWTSTKQRCMATSTTESEYVALSEASKQGQWLRSLLRELGRGELLGDDLEVPIFSDNQACIAIANEPVAHKRSKHIDVRYHQIRDLIASRQISVEYCSTGDMKADMLTKPLTYQSFQKCIGGMLR